MEAREVVVSGDLTEDGRLVLDETPDLPPGKVEVRVRAVEGDDAEAPDWFAAVDEARAKLDAQGFKRRSFAEIVADVNAMRDEWDND